MSTSKPQTWRTQADQIKAAISSSTCSPALATELQELLAPKKHDEETKENIRPAQTKTPAARRTKATSSARTKAKVDVVEDNKLILPTPKERFLIATAVVNTSLKTLTDALKSQPKAQRQLTVKTQSSRSPLKPVGASSPKTPRSPLARSASCPQKPLQPRSVSQVSSAAAHPLSRRSSSYSLASHRGPPSYIVATAECARLAFAYLRSSEGVKAAGENLPPSQLDSGMLALIGKLLSHGLENLAVKELHVLKRRLQRSAGKTSGSGPGTHQQEKETLATLIQVPGFDANNPPSESVITYQSYVLRAIAAMRRPQVIEATVEQLELENPGSPYEIIMEWSRKGGDHAKAAKYLETLAQTILSLCPSISSSEDGLACDSKIQPCAEAVLQLQRITFQVRFHWAKLAGKDGTISKELLEMFSKCLAAFVRRSTMDPKEKYSLAKTQFDNLHKTLESLDQLASNPATSSVSKISRTLSSLAQSASLQDEALRWTQGEDAERTAGARSEAKTASRLVRIAALSLDKYIAGESSTEIAEPLNAALESLKGGLKGDSADLDGLLCEVTGLRRVATKPFLENGTNDKAQKAIRSLCYSAISACVRFLVRYLGSKPNGADPKAFLRHGQRFNTVKKIAKSVVDCAIAACRALLASSAIQWEDLDACLTYCMALVKELQGESHVDEAESQEFHQSLQYPLVKISNIYWAFYLHLRESDSAGQTSLTKVMRKSIDAVKDRTSTERQLGSLGMKLEKFAETLQVKGVLQEAYDTLSLAAEGYIVSGALQEAVALADKQPLQTVWDSSTEMQSLARVLLTRSKLGLRLSDSNPAQKIFFDDEDLDTNERGLLAEWQWNGLSKLLRKQRTIGDGLRAAIDAAIENLWSFYPIEKYPIRRRRVAFVFLQLITDHPSILGFEMPSEIAQCEDCLPKNLANDSNLEEYGAHIQAAIRASLALQESSPSIGKLKEALAVWQSILDTVEDKSALSARVDDFERWIGLLGAITQFLAVKGLDYLRIPALQLACRALEMFGNKHSSMLVEQLSELGLQYLRLGYSGKAGMSLGKAQGIVDSADVSAESKLQWQLAYAEYLLSIGNLEKR
jgi:separase